MQRIYLFRRNTAIEVGCGKVTLCEVAYDVVTTLCYNRRKVGCCAFKTVPVAFFDPVGETAPADAEGGGDLRFVKVGLEEEVFSLLLFFVIHDGWLIG